MGDRVIDFSDRPAYLSVNNSLLVMRLGPSPFGPDGDGENEDEPSLSNEESPPRNETHTVPLEEIAVVVVSHPQVTYTHAVLPGLAAAGGVLIACDSKHMPAAMMLPLVTHSLQTERFPAQAKASLPTCKRLWQQIVKSKIEAQAQLLEYRRGMSYGLRVLASEVRSGDPVNLEARAARVYWLSLFGETFRRNREAEDINRHLNYGYAILRAITARAICAAGLHPSLGIHHHNRYDAFCLADDVMEPFRPLVDRAVVNLYDRHGMDVPMDRYAKRELLASLLERYEFEDEARTLFDWVSRTAFSLAAVICEEAETLFVPRLVNVRDATHPEL